jgi:NAD(P)-dependent dehydrogenase (short-subunit alcohol dehydrogenase family)
MSTTKRILVTGAGGFIGHHLVRRLKADGFWVRGVDIKHPDYEPSVADEFELLDLRRFDQCLAATQNINQVYNLAADMGGIGYITAFLASISCNNTLINAHMLEASRLGKTLGGGTLPLLLQRLQAGNQNRPIPQRVRPAGNVRWWQGKSPRGHLAQGSAGQRWG